MGIRLVFTVTTDLNFDQRMQRICHSLAQAGYSVCLVGRQRPDSPPLSKALYEQQRLTGWFERGPLFYLEYNLRLLFWLLRHQRSADALVAIDLDTILPVWLASKTLGCARVYDAHELFCEMQEIVSRPRVYRIWKALEKLTVPRFRWGYTVNQPIANEFKRMYGVDYAVIRNIARWEAFTIKAKEAPYLLYQGAVNEGRCFETLIPAMKEVDIPLYICGDGNFMKQAKALAKSHQLEDKVIFKGRVSPEELRVITRGARAGITLFEARGQSNYYSLANRFFDYLHAYLPQVCVDYPVYREINDRYGVAVLVPDTKTETLAQALNNLLNNGVVYETIRGNCIRAAQELNWQEEEKILLGFYERLSASLSQAD